MLSPRDHCGLSFEPRPQALKSSAHCLLGSYLTQDALRIPLPAPAPKLTLLCVCILPKHTRVPPG